MRKKKIKIIFLNLDFLTSIILIGFSIYVIYESIRMPTWYKGILGFLASPGFFPFIVGIFLLFLSVVLMIRTIKKLNLSPNINVNINIIDIIKSKSLEIKRGIVVIVSTALYIHFFKALPFTILTFIYLAFLFCFLKASPKVWINIVYALLASIAAYGITQALQIPLPQGW